ncbi:Sec-independent protein translocase protein TatB [Chitiniphilus purpureus]|uniref:Sec-independent protein translocase protein TatB n=1 Tax=Chitiniphilus purpureus TaxID=2981137 RepID=A0ABY6DLH7_9NEIS|nr:Sec-independent protein translocase protein TatB [Chitiniphilus sp. CD1]UXY15199.1 Sec-independent protein translocase protein TatB [Chitiniphilus sp. CD1]
MFDIGFGELLVIGAVALVVLGPERLPKVARTVGALVGRAQRFAASVKADLDRDLAKGELAALEAELRQEGEALRRELHAPLIEAQQALTIAPEPPPAAVMPSAAAAEVPPPAPPYDERQLDLFDAPVVDAVQRDRR